jgi:hypothetical protein
MKVYFQSLRQQYPERLEFRHFSVDDEIISQNLKAALNKLGFAVPSVA